MKKTVLLCILFCVCSSLTLVGQTVEITGKVTDPQGEPLSGASVVVKDQPGLGTVTNPDGTYRIKTTPYTVLVFSYLGFDKQEIPVKDQQVINVVMKESDSSVLNEVVITATGAQKKVAVTGAITTVDVRNLRMPTANITNALAGNVAGIISMQISGEPGANQSEFWIRGISTFGAKSSALILVDGFERPFNEINIEDIESFSVLKDASATAVYGSRGANGVILITTKKGNAGKINISVKTEYGYNTRTRTPKFVDGYTYASLANEATTTRNMEPIYKPIELEILKNNLDPDIYPNIDWMDVLLRDGAGTYRANISMNGGGSTTRYFVSGSYVEEEGMYKSDAALTKFKTNSKLRRWNYRSNVDIDVTKTTLLRTGVSGFLEKQNRAGLNDNIWNSIAGTTPTVIPLVYSNGMVPAYGISGFTNPWTLSAETGFKEFWRSKVETNITVEQNFDLITKGLRFIGRFAFDSDNKNNINHTMWPEQYKAERRRNPDGSITFKRISTERLMNQESDSWGERIFNTEAELHYERTFLNDHSIGAMMKYSQREQAETSNVGSDVKRGIPRRNQSLAGRFTYNFRNRYFFDFNGGYTGSEVFRTGHQFGFFPAVSGGWNISEEPWLKAYAPWLDLWKIRYSYGIVGNEKIMQGNDEIRFPWIESIGYMNDGNSVYDFGDYYNNYPFSGLYYQQVASDQLSWETTAKHNFGVDLYLFGNKFSTVFDVFKNTTSSIYKQRSHLSSMVGIVSSPWANVGKMEAKGFDGQFALNHRITKVEFTMRGNITYVQNQVLEYDEEANVLPYKMTQGYRWQQAKGLIALGLFNDFDDIRNSPRQTFGQYLPGDIKYKDVNGDGIIDNNDEVAIGSTRIPCLMYGMGLSMSWNGFDFNIHFQGAGQSSYFISGTGVYPFVAGEWGNVLEIAADPANRWISREISGNPATERADALFPRLSYTKITWRDDRGEYFIQTSSGGDNNYRNSTFWLRDGSYIRFKTLEIGYTIPKRLTNKVKMNSVRFHFVGNNLFVWDKLKIWDPELAVGDGMKYPLTRTLTLGFTVNM